ncbi:MAG: Spore germination protein [Desulfotomaculum sp. 46_296]|nr:MAG: Spore germination protein [Desulfotomaculum sp. 46_296]HAU31519.1 hypothetical protein [Desulfotomaculum sp.]
MLREGKIGVFEAVCLISVAIVTKLFFTSPRQLVETVGSASWFGHIIAVCISTVGFLYIFLLMKRFPGQDLVSVFETVFGKVLPLGIITFPLCLLIPDLTTVVSLTPLIRDSFGWAVYFGIPLLALLVAAARGKKGVKTCAQQPD